MAFKVNDLMINIIPAEGAGLAIPPCDVGRTLAGGGGGVVCGCSGMGTYPVCAHPSHVVQTLFVVCPGPTVIGPVGVPLGGDPAVARQQLAALKVQLQQALAQIEAQEQVLDQSLQPQTAAQVEELQSKMRDALAELEKRKSELEKK